MELFKKSKINKGYTIIIGCGRLGANLANSLSDQDGDVLIIDKNEDSFRKLASSFGGLTLAGDATDLDILKEAQMDKASVVVAVTNNDNINIMVSLMAKEIFKINHIISRLYDPDRKCVYRELGIDTICPAILSANEIDKILSTTEVDKNVKNIFREVAR